MEDVITLYNGFELITNPLAQTVGQVNRIGYVSTFVKINRKTNDIINVSYHFMETFSFSPDNLKVFATYQELQDYINILAQQSLTN